MGNDQGNRPRPPPGDLHSLTHSFICPLFSRGVWRGVVPRWYHITRAEAGGAPGRRGEVDGRWLTIAQRIVCPGMRGRHVRIVGSPAAS